MSLYTRRAMAFGQRFVQAERNVFYEAYYYDCHIMTQPPLGYKKKTHDV